MDQNHHSEFTVKYGGEQPEISANTFLHSLLDITSLIQEINQELGTGKPLDIKIKSLNPGSFLVDVHILGFIESIKTLLTVENLKTVGELIGTLTGLIKLKQVLKKDEPLVKPTQQGDSITFEKADGSNITIDNRTYNLYIQNSTVRDLLSNNFETLANDPNISTFELLSEDKKPLVSVQRKEFAEMTSVPEENETEPIEQHPEVITEDAELYIVRASFDKKLRWDFIYKSNKISATVDDEKFIEKVRAGEEGFYAGDILAVELSIKRKFDENAQVFYNKSFRITKVKKHIRRIKEQMPLFPQKQSVFLEDPKPKYKELPPADEEKE